MSIGIIIFAVFSLFFFWRAMTNQNAGQHLWNVLVDLVCLVILAFSGTSLDSMNGYMVIFIFSLDLTGFILTKCDQHI